MDDFAFAKKLQRELDEEAGRKRRIDENADADFALALSLDAKKRWRNPPDAKDLDAKKRWRNPSDATDQSARHENTDLALADPKKRRKEPSDAKDQSDRDFALALSLSETLSRGDRCDDIRRLGGAIRVLEHGAFHLPGFLPPQKQAELYAMFERDGFLKPCSSDLDLPYWEAWRHMKCSGEDVKPAQLLAFDIGEQALKYVTQCTAEKSWGDDVHLDCCSTTGYGSGGYLHMHVDWAHMTEYGGVGLGGWVVLLSLGASAEFCYGAKCMTQAKSCEMASGDVLILQGCTVYHGIKRLFGDVPDFWTLKKTRRLGVQMRDHRHTVPGWDATARVGTSALKPQYPSLE
eukprot:Hpha_TRINITY_DN3768_c0_g1::TRINITY_DN3768_c0_g1_i1::g.23872::m.23872